MNNAKKISARAKPKPKRAARPRKPKGDISVLPDAIVDGKLVIPVKSRVAFIRPYGGTSGPELHQGYIFSYDEETGDLTIWDDNRGQFWTINTVANGSQVTCKSLVIERDESGTT